MPDLLNVLELVLREDRGSDVDVVDLLDWLKIPDGWIASADDSAGAIDEVLTLNIDETDIDGLATVLQDIDLKVKEIDNARRPNEIMGVWLRAQLTGETNARQAYLLRGRRGRQVRVSSPAMYSSTLLQYPLGLTRLAWETTTGQEIPVTPTDVSAHGGSLAYSTPGDVDGRISLAQINQVSGTTFYEVWLGVKSEQYGNVDPNKFIPFWGIDVRSYTQGIDVSEAADANAVCGKHLKIEFSVANVMITRFAIRVNAVTPYVSDQRGKYIVLVRCYTDSADLELELRCGQGYMQGNTLRTATFSYGDPVPIASANAGYRYYSLGEFELPPVPSLTDIDMNLAALAFQAEKTAGTGSLYVDGLLLIPAEHFIHVKSEQTIGSSVYTLYILTTPDKRYRSIVSFEDTGVESTIEQNPVDQLTWLLPAGDGAIICCASGPVSDVDDEITPAFTVYPSFSTLRGAA